MKIYVDKIPAEGLEFNETCESPDWDLERSDIKFGQSILLAGKATKAAGMVSVNVKVNSTIRMTCSRCLKEFTVPLDKAMNIVYKLEGRKILDLARNIREEIIMDYPLKPVCSSGCKGLCPACGVNLNEKTCVHQTKPKNVEAS